MNPDAREVEARRKIAARVEPCDDTCPGWFVDQEDDRFQRCDDCFSRSADADALSDDEVDALPEARRALARHVAADTDAPVVLVDDNGEIRDAQTIGDGERIIAHARVVIELEDAAPSAGELGYWILENQSLEAGLADVVRDWNSDGRHPVWNATGKEGTFRDDDGMRAVTVNVRSMAIVSAPPPVDHRVAMRAARDWIDANMPRDCESAERARDVLQALALAIGDE